MSVFWGSRDVNAVLAAGVATQLFPSSIKAADMANTTSTGSYPPNPVGNVRRPRDGKLFKLEITGDGTNSGTLELWDVCGTDRSHDAGSDAYNVNNGDTLTDAYLTAHGTLIGKKLVNGTGAASFTELFESIPFSKGLAVRFVNAGPTGKVSIAPYVEGGFMLRPVVC